MGRTVVTDDEIREATTELLPDLVSDLIALSAVDMQPGRDPGGSPLAAHRKLAGLLDDCGVTEIGGLVAERTSAPVLTARLPGPAGAPTVLIHNAYPLVSAEAASRTERPAGSPSRVGDAVVGQGVTGSKASIIAILGALRILRDRLPVTLKLVLEGQRALGPLSDDDPLRSCDLAADAVLIAGAANIRPGMPTMTVALRGAASVVVGLRTMEDDRQGGHCAGAAPDARLALLRALASLHDDAGDVAVPGLRRSVWSAASCSESEFRRRSGVLPGVPLQGTGTIGQRLWFGPAITVVAFDAPATGAPSNAVPASARAVLDLHLHPEQDAAEAQRALVDHLRAQHPFGVTLEVVAGETADGFTATAGGTADRAIRHALETAWGVPVQALAGGGALPVLTALRSTTPAAETVILGALHGDRPPSLNGEQVLVDELAKALVALTIFLRDYGRKAMEVPR